MADSGSKAKGVLAGAGIVAALGGGLARSADDIALAGCRSTRAVSVTAEGATAGNVARSGSNLVDDGLRAGHAGLPRAASPVPRGRPWMVAAGEGDDSFRVGTSVDDIAPSPGTAARAESAEGTSHVDTVLDLSLDAVDLADDPTEPALPRGREHLEGTLGISTTPFVETPRAVLVKTWAADGGAGVPQPPNVVLVEGADVADRGWNAVLRAMPQANPLVILASSNDRGRTLSLGNGRLTRISELHATCTSAGRHCVTMLCAAASFDPSPCMVSLPDVFDKAAAAAVDKKLSHDAFSLMLGRARTTWDATANVDLAYVKVRWEGGSDGTYRSILTHL